MQSTTELHSSTYAVNCCDYKSPRPFTNSPSIIKKLHICLTVSYKIKQWHTSCINATVLY